MRSQPPIAPVADTRPALSASGIAKTYRGASRAALDSFEIQVAAGEIFGLLGPNGAGKTTAISIMATLLRPDRGTVVIDGIDAVAGPREARRMIGFVPQDIALYPRLSIRENFVYFGRLYGLKGRELLRRIDHCLALTGLSEKGRQRVSSCSGGMKRRANLGVGLLQQPKILFLDEPTVGIDAQSKHTIFQGLTALATEGVAMVYTTHAMQEAEALCSRVAVMDGGGIIAQGSPGRLVADTPGCGNLGDLFLELTGKQLRE
jgi:ABC-2 type transport system ATP-binding protein